MKIPPEKIPVVFISFSIRYILFRLFKNHWGYFFIFQRILPFLSIHYHRRKSFSNSCNDEREYVHTKREKGGVVIRKFLFIVLIFSTVPLLLSFHLANSTSHPVSPSVVFIGEEDIFSAFIHDEDSVVFHFIDVGQGDSTFITFPTGETMLIDGGKPEQGKSVLKYLKKEGIHHLDWVVATHPDYDHIGGLISVLQHMDVTYVLDSGKEKDTKTYETYQRTLRKKDVIVKIAKEGEVLPIAGAKVTILNAGRKSEEPNDSSIVLHVETDNHAALLLGDIPQKIEKEIIRKYHIHADVLKVAHHGSYTSTSSELIKTIHPSVAILTYGKENDFGHPHGIVTHRLKRHGTTLISTERSGNIKISFTKQGVFVLDASLIFL